VNQNGWIIWLHEREWRSQGDFTLPDNPYGVLLKDTRDVGRLQEIIAANPEKFKSKPRSIIPLEIVCQGLTHMW
jgi:hypothetical protein